MCRNSKSVALKTAVPERNAIYGAVASLHVLHVQQADVLDDKRRLTMALIKCSECGSEISETASACPRCGAAVVRKLGDHEDQCPHCMTVVNASATKCPSCGAVKGYMFDRRYGAFGKTGTIVWGIVFPSLLAIGAAPVTKGVSLLLMLLPVYAAYRLYVTGPRWWTTVLPR